MRNTLKSLKMQGEPELRTQGCTALTHVAHDHAAAFKDSPEERAMFEIGLEVS
jgi:hypothetical protein